MRAVRLTEWRSPPRLEHVPVPVPRAGELLVEVRAAGICGSDLHVMGAGAGVFDYPLPMTLGHEVAGVVAEAGAGVDSSWLGQTVVVHGVWACGSCRNCRSGRENYCFGFGSGPRGLEPIGVGLGRDGGLADFLLVPSERHLVPAAGMDPAILAPLADAGLTAYHAVRSNRGVLNEESVALVIGAGGLGHLAIQVLKATTPARIVAMDTNDEALELALRSGADVATADLARARGLCLDDGGAGGADLILDFVGADGTLDGASRALARGGRLVIVGSGGGVLHASKSGSLPGGWTAAAPFWGTKADLRAVVELARRGELRPHVEISPLGEALDVYRRLGEGRVRGRAVLVP